MHLFVNLLLFRAAVAHPERLGDNEKAAYRAPHPDKIGWAMKDPAFTPRMLEELWLQTFPDVEVMRLEDASHFLQEDAHERIVPELVRFAGA